MAILEVEHLKKTYTTRLGSNRVEALKDVNFTVERGEFVAIMGESGSGKTTLLNLLAALDKPTGGQVRLNGKNLGELKEKEIAGFRRENLGFVFQDFNLLDTFSLRDNIYLPLVLEGKKYEEMSLRAEPIAKKLGITQILNKYPYEVSGGQKQRAAVARALITNPELVLADEPSGALDSHAADGLMKLFGEINEEGQTIVMVTHSVKAACSAKRVLFIKDSSDDVEIAGASPETLVKVEDGEVRTFPLAGTRQRGKSYEEDQRLEKELLADEKERAEHNMLVDLGRNDLGKICDFGTVEVEKYMSIERYSHVMHIGSTVKGQLRKDKTAVDAIDSVLPAGTLSGAPKLRACQIINELENNKRGIYGGAIGYLDFTGNMDTCIAIRLAFKKNGKVFVRSGAGIVADSVPEKEHQECINKAKAVMVALAEAEGGSNL